MSFPAGLWYTVRMQPAAHESVMSFTRELASKSPAPGGGAAGAVTGSIAAALAGMVVAYSVNRKSLTEHRPRLRAMQEELNEIRRRALDLAEEDAAAYTRLNRLQRVSDPSEHHTQQVAGAAMTAMGVPLELVESMARLAGLLAELEPISNPHLRSDLVSAAALGAGAAATGLEMVRVNSGSLADGAGAAAERRAAELSEACARIAGELSAGS